MSEIGSDIYYTSISILEKKKRWFFSEKPVSNNINSDKPHYPEICVWIHVFEHYL